MIKRLKYIAISLLATLTVLVSCQPEDKFNLPGAVPEGYMRITFSAAIPDMTEVSTRAVDIDGGGVQNMSLLCFDAHGLFISVEDAVLPTPGGNSGTFSAEVPNYTRIIHFLANQNMRLFEESELHNKSEAEVMGVLEGSSGRMIYWARFAASTAANAGDLATQLKAQAIKVSTEADAATANVVLLRNHAYVRVNTDTDDFTTTGFVVYNTMAYGTVAPYDHDNNKFPTLDEWRAGNYVTLPEKRIKMSNVTGVNNAALVDGVATFGQFIFECENNLADPVSVILRGYNKGESANDAKFYRVLLQDNRGNTIPLRRNYRYTLNFNGQLNNGRDNFNDALDAPATNNIWVSIDEKIKEVSDPNYTLTMHETAVIWTGSTLETITDTVYYNYVKDNASAPDVPISVDWLDEQNVASSKRELTGSFLVDGKTYNGATVLELTPMGEDQQKREGTLVVKYGQLQRTIKVITIKEQAFTPAWVSTQVYGGNQSTTNPDVTNLDQRAHVTAMFTIPESTPKEAFPMNVLISVNNLDVRNASGMVLPVVKKGDADYMGDDIRLRPDEPESPTNPVLGYKYVLEVEQAGVQRVYLENTLIEKADSVDYITFEALHFKKATKVVTFSGSSTLSIACDDPNVKGYYGEVGDIEEAPIDEQVRYMLVPQKINAPVDIYFRLKRGRGTTTPIAPNLANPNNANSTAVAAVKDEFILYTQNLYPDTTQNPAHCNFHDFFPGDNNNNNSGPMHSFTIESTDDTLAWKMQLHTIRARSEEPIRLSSNQHGSQSGLVSGTYTGNEYRSFVVEIANYRPFSFLTTLKSDKVGQLGDSTATTTMYPTKRASTDVKVKNSHLTVGLGYANVGTPVDLEINLKGFTGSDNKWASPFGTEFEVYIDAPMLAIDDSRLPAAWKDWKNSEGFLIDRLRKGTDGRYVYTVAANDVDATITLPFVTNAIVTDGEIVVSSNQEKVVFDNEIFTIVNIPHTGTIQSMGKDVKAGEFVAIEKASDNTRIASITVVEDGVYEMRLRKEYDFDWYTQVRISYGDKNPDTNAAVTTSMTCYLYQLFDNPAINMMSKGK